MICIICRTYNPDTNKFCSECGTKLSEEGFSKAQDSPVEEKKQATIFFADLSGFTAMSERLDPEEVKDIMQGILSKSASIVNKYGGRVDKFIGDCVMAVFGIPQANEDDAVRAIHAAMDIHAAVDALNTPELEAKIGRKLAMHTGINTGMVVSGDLDIEKGSEKIIGDTVNVASRLSGVAKQGEIVVGHDTFTLADWHFEFEALPPVSVKGKSESLNPYRIIGHKKAADTFRRLRGRKARFIGREQEIDELVSAMQALASGKGSIISVSGDAGTGKSRLVSEIRIRAESMDGYRWFEAFAYSHAENIAYSFWIDFVNRLLSIEESDSKDQVHQKLKGIVQYCREESIIPFIAALYSINYPETKGIDPGSLKMNISNSIISLVIGIARSGKTIFYFDDLHWADPSSLEILQTLFQELDAPAVFLCLHRPGISISPEKSSGKELFKFYELALQPLGSDNEERMIASLLESDKVPRELMQYFIKKISGTPFFIEEIINNLIETKALSFEEGAWKLTRSLTETDIPLSIQGVITARIDRLDPTAKRVLQAASVIGQSFYYSLLKRVTELSRELDDCLAFLESVGMIWEEAREPDIAYLFKHALLRDVVYNSLLKKDRGTIHQRVAQLLEVVFKDRIEEFYETIAFHYQKSGDSDKAVEYLVKAGRKSMASYASAEANNFYRQAYDILIAKPGRTEEENTVLIRFLNDWGFTHYYLGTFLDWTGLFKKHVRDADSIPDKGAKALFYAELGYALDFVMENDLSMKYQYEALRLARESGDKRALAYANCWLSDRITRGHPAECIEHGDAGMKLSREIPEEPYLFAKSAFGKGICLACRGEIMHASQIGQEILDFGKKRNNPTCISLAYGAFYYIEYYAKNWIKVIELMDSASKSKVTVEPLYLNFNKPMLAIALINLGRYNEAEEVIKNCEGYFRNVHLLSQLTLIEALRSLLLIFKNHEYDKGIKKLGKLIASYEKANWSYYTTNFTSILGSLYMGIAAGKVKFPAHILLKNLPFIIMNMPFAWGRSVRFFEKSLEIAKECGIYSHHGRSAMNLGILYKMRKKFNKARSYFNEAVIELEKTDLSEELESARQALSGL